MILASTLEKHGMAASQELREDIKYVIGRYRPKHIIETGTYMGLGSTSAILYGLKEADIKGFSFISMESNPDFYKIAKQNLDEEYNGSLVLMNKVSVPRNLLPSKVDHVPDNIITDHIDPQHYTKEVPRGVEDNGLLAAMMLLEFAPDLVLLDSAGHLGTIEFEYLLTLAIEPFILILDDTLHRKHYKTMEKIKADPIRFEILKESKNKFGHAIIQVN